MSRDKVYITFPWNHSTVEGLTVVQILLRVRTPHAPITPGRGILGQKKSAKSGKGRRRENTGRRGGRGSGCTGNNGG